MSVLHLLDLESGVVPPSALHPETQVGKREEATNLAPSGPVWGALLGWSLGVLRGTGADRVLPKKTLLIDVF